GRGRKPTSTGAWTVAGDASVVTIWGTVGEAGPLVASASATSLVEPELGSTLADNTAVLTIAPPVVTPVHRGPPVLRLGGGGFTPPLAGRIGPAGIVKAMLSVDEPVALTISAEPLILLAKSQVGGARAAKSQPQLVDKVDVAGTVKLAVRIRYASLRLARGYRVVVVATAADGQRSRLVIPFRR